MHLALPVLLFNAMPSLVDTFNLTEGKLTRAGDKYEVGGFPCTGLVEAWSAMVDEKNGYLSVEGVEPTGANCEVPRHIEFAAFMRANGDYVWLWSDFSTASGGRLVAYDLIDQKLSPRDVGLPTLTELLPSEFAKPDASAVLNKHKVQVRYLLPRKGTTVVVKVPSFAPAKLCKELKVATCPTKTMPAIIKKYAWDRAAERFVAE